MKTHFQKEVGKYRTYHCLNCGVSYRKSVDIRFCCSGCEEEYQHHFKLMSRPKNPIDWIVITPRVRSKLKPIPTTDMAWDIKNSQLVKI